MPFIILFGFTYWIAKTSVNSQVSDTLSQGIGDFQFLFPRSRGAGLGQRFGHCHRSKCGRGFGRLRMRQRSKIFFNKQKGDRAWVDIWLALDPQGNIISDLSGSTAAGRSIFHPAIVQKSFAEKGHFVSIETVNPDEWPSVFGNWTVPKLE